MTARMYTAPIAAMIAAGALVLSGCSTGGDEGDGGDEGLPYGASKEDYIAAFEDIDPIVLRIQTEGTEGTLGALPREAYAEALDEWSGGKLTLEIGYSNSFVPDSASWDEALADGRLDIGMYIPTYKPDIYPLYKDIGAAWASTPWTPGATYILGGWMSELGYEEEYLEETLDQDIVTLIPALSQMQYATLWCAEPIEDFTGLQISASGTAKAAQVEALGGVPVSMPFTDQYEALERGVISCALTSNGAVDAAGLAPLVPYEVLDSRVAFENSIASIGVGRAVWEDLPLVAQQLIFDRLDVLLATEATEEPRRNLKTFNDIEAEGGGPIELTDENAEAIRDVNARLMEEIPADRRERIEELQEKWTDIVNDTLDIPEDMSFADYIRSEAYEDIDFQPYIDAYFEEILLDHRPGGA